MKANNRTGVKSGVGVALLTAGLGILALTAGAAPVAAEDTPSCGDWDPGGCYCVTSTTCRWGHCLEALIWMGDYNQCA